MTSAEQNGAGFFALRSSLVTVHLSLSLRGADVAQLVEHVLGKDGVSSSNLLLGSREKLGSQVTRGSNSGVESQPSKLLVAGSNPVSRSIFPFAFLGAA